MYSIQTRDLRLASYLWAQPYYPVSFEGVRPIAGNLGMFNFIFNFEATQDQVDQLISDYHNDRAQIEPNMYMSKMGRLRDALSSNGVSTTKNRR